MTHYASSATRHGNGSTSVPGGSAVRASHSAPAVGPPIRKIVVIGPGIVGMPMAAMLASAAADATEPNALLAAAEIVVLQRASPTSGWKVAAINEGRSPIGGLEPDLDALIAGAVAMTRLRASSDYGEVRDADFILVCVQTDRTGFAPDYGPLCDALTGVACALTARARGDASASGADDRRPVIVIESTLAPSSMASTVRALFASHGLVDGRDIALVNSPNRVMPGRLVDRVRNSDKVMGALHAESRDMAARVYGEIVTSGTLHLTNSMTAECVKTLENAYRDVRIAYAAEVARYCDARDVDFYAVRDAVNARAEQVDEASGRPDVIPSGGMLIPTLGVGGHCLPKDGVLLWWRALADGLDATRSLILEARRINDESPAYVIGMLERTLGSVSGHTVALLGTAYRVDSNDTRNAPTLSLARALISRGGDVRLHDPFVERTDQNVEKSGCAPRFTRDLPAALRGADAMVLCVGHGEYVGANASWRTLLPATAVVIDACNGCDRGEAARWGGRYAGIGRGVRAPDASLIETAYDGLRAIDRGVSNELETLVHHLNAHYADDEFNRVDAGEIRRLARTCVTGCAIGEPGPVGRVPATGGFTSRLVDRAVAASDGP
ncbi:MAG: nucleotide sugar dehydrogenase [Gemmatimonadaceae bacterium]